MLIVGGSQGANIFDSNLKEIIVNLSKQFPIKVTQQTNEKNISAINGDPVPDSIRGQLDQAFSRVQSTSAD